MAYLAYFYMGCGIEQSDNFCEYSPFYVKSHHIKKLSKVVYFFPEYVTASSSIKMLIP